MSRFTGPQGPPSKDGRRNKGVMKAYRALKRRQAEARAAGNSAWREVT